MNLTNKTTPLVSICCIAYNQAKYIQNTIDGFLLQKTNFPIEIIIHDDASTDDTVEIIKHYANRYPELFVLILQTTNQYSQGVKPWLDFVFPIAKGKYLALCEGDDYWTDPFKLQKQVDYLEKNQSISFCFHNALSHYIDTNTKKPFNIKLKSGIYKTKDILLKKWFIPTASIVLKKELLPNPYPEYFYKINSGDYALALILSTKNDIYYINQKMSVYRKNAENSLSINQVNPYNHLIQKTILLKNFYKFKPIKIKIIVFYSILITRLQIIRAKIYYSIPIVVIIKNKLNKLLQ